QLAGGVGSAVAELLADTQHTGVALLRLGLPDQFTSHGARAQLLAAAGLDADSIAHRIATFVRAGTTWAVERR
ncbi:MAG TPA: 1-deoxy-D-xylulose-5-phosphate synthase, partial [Proteobacteria bacterium]|nr:1-deoxy-D-xylulose-5-phosphate synthase [Pseudomonadota bacterium]